MSMRIIPLTILLGFILSTGCNGPKPESGEVTAVVASSDSLPENVPEISVEETDWPWWRGLTQIGITTGQQVPSEWGPEKNLIWKTDVPGRGHSSPTLVGNKIFLATAVEEAATQSVLAYDRETGDLLWEKTIHSGGLTSKNAMHSKSSHASSTIASDGKHLFAVFLNRMKIHATALDFEGEIVWQKVVGDFSPKFGYAPSPILYKSLVIVTADHWKGGFISALNRSTGELVWRIKRPSDSTYATPVIVKRDAGDLLVIGGCEKLSAFDAGTGSEVWAVDGTAEAAVGTAIWENDKVVASGGYPGKNTICVNVESGETVWQNNVKIYVPSLVIVEGFVYAVTDEGIGYCWSLQDGKEQWKSRIGGNFSASPVVVNGNILISNEAGQTIVFEANPQEFKLISKNKLGDEAFASPVVVGNRIYLRHAFQGDERQEVLFCIGQSEAL